MPLHTSDALILRTYALGESDRIVVFLTRDRGKKLRELVVAVQGWKGHCGIGAIETGWVGWRVIDTHGALEAQFL